MLSPVPLFNSFKESLGVLLLSILFFAIHLGFIYNKYLDFKAEEYHVLKGTLLKHHEKVSKNGKPYHVLHVKSSGFLIYTVTWKKELDIRKGEAFNFTIVSKNVSFLDYLSKRFFASSFRLHPLHKVENSLKESLYRAICVQHESPKLQNLFAALFLGVPVENELRVDITHWGVAHLVAISGFHLSVLMALGYLILNPLYKWFQSRFFPYRNRKLDLGILLLGLVFGYAWLIDFVPSFVRSFVMAVLVFVLLMRHIKLVSFGVLALCTMLLLSFFPSLALHLGFGFSVLGVFYIFLYLHHFKDAFKSKWLHAAILNLWVFLAMIIPVHYWFDLNSLQQWGAVPLSLLFIVFYPLVTLLHLLGFGGVLDSSLEAMLSFRLVDAGSFNITMWTLFGYLALSLLAIRYKWLAVFVISLGILPFMIVQISA